MDDAATFMVKQDQDVEHREEECRHSEEIHGNQAVGVIFQYRFIDWVLSLSEELDNLFWEDLSNFEEN